MGFGTAVCVRYSGKHLLHNFLISMTSAFFKNMTLNQGKPGDRSGLYHCMIFLSLRIYPCKWKTIIPALKIIVVN